MLASEETDSVAVTKDDVDRCEAILDMLIAEAKKDGITDAETAFGEWKKDVQMLNGKINETQKLKIAVYGNTGEGKSSLLSALFDQADLLPRGGMGTACTSVITKIEKVDERGDNLDKEETGFQAEITFFTEEEWKMEFDLLQKDLTGDGDRSESKARDLASSRLQTVYGNFSSLSELEEKIHNRPDINEKLNTKISTEIFGSAKELRGEIERYVAVKKDTNKLWPIVKSVAIRIYNIKVECDGIIFTDMPGVQDSNPVRVAMADEEQQFADILLVVAKIDRIKDNPTVKKILGQEMFRQIEMDAQEHVIVCTRTDESIDVEGAKACMEPEERQKADDLVAGIKKCKKEIRELKKAKSPKSSNTSGNDQSGKVSEIERRLSEEDSKIKKFTSSLDILCAKARNSAIKKDREADTTGVFCVCSTDYLELIDDGTGRVFMDEEDTEIPALRKFLQEKAVDQKRKNQMVIQRKFQSIISEMLSYLLNFELGGKKQAKEKVSQVLQDIERELKILAERFGEAVDAKYNPLKQAISEGVSAAEESAVARCVGWSSDVATEYTEYDEGQPASNLPVNTFKATTRRLGLFIRGPDEHDRIDFNADLAGPFMDKINQPWLDVFGMWEKLIESKAMEPAGKVIRYHAKKLQSILHDSQKKELSENLDLMTTEAISKLEELRNTIKEIVRPGQKKASRIVKQTIQEQMTPTYNECTEECGDGAYSRIKGKMKSGVEELSSTIFKSVEETLLKEIDGLKEMACDHIHDLLSSIVKSYKQQIDGLWIKQEGQEFTDLEALEKAKDDLRKLQKQDQGSQIPVSVTPKSVKRSRSGSLDEPAKKSKMGFEGKIQLTYATREQEQEAFGYLSENLRKVFQEVELVLTKVELGSVNITFTVPDDLTREGVEHVRQFLLQHNSPSIDSFTVDIGNVTPCNLTFVANNVQVGSSNTMNVQTQETSTAQARGLTEELTIKISCNDERKLQQIRAVLDAIKELMESPHFNMDIQQYVRSVSLNIRRHGMTVLSMFKMAIRIVNSKFLVDIMGDDVSISVTDRTI